MTTGKGTINAERNQTLYDDWKSGKYTVNELVSKYGITKTRIYAIVKRMKIYEVAPDILNDQN